MRHTEAITEVAPKRADVLVLKALCYLHTLQEIQGLIPPTLKEIHSVIF